MSTASVLLGLPAGCLSPDAPRYEAPPQTPPILDLYTARPRVTNIVDLASGQTESFSVNVRSEDAGERLVALAFLDYGTTDQSVQANFSLDPSVFEDLGRSINFSYNTSDPGCHVLLLLVTHIDNFFGTSEPLRDPQDVALANWWIRVRPLDGPPLDCTDAWGAN